MIRKTLAALALSVAGIATVGMGTASADVHTSEIAGKFPTRELCEFQGHVHLGFGADGFSCLSWNGGPYVLRVW